MKAMMLTDIRQMQMVEVPTPQIQNDTDVLIKMSVVGICGSDVHYYTAGKIGSQVIQYPYTVGHEGAGIVKETGKSVTRIKPGDRIAIEPAISCGSCDQCLSGRPHTCRALKFLGCPGQVEGCLSEYKIMPEASCYPIPDSMSFEEAAISEPLAIGLYAVKLSAPMHGTNIAILGVGPIGLSTLLCAKSQGAKYIYVTDKIDERLDMARRIGADWGGNPDKEDVISTIEYSEGRQPDVVFECCGQQEALDQAIDMLKPGGSLLIVGIPAILDRVSFEVDKIRRKEICIQNVRRQNRCVQPALDMIANGAIDVSFMVTHRFGFDQTQEAFDLVSGYRDGVIKAMVHFD